jgi:putative ABC transport system permease protein
MSDASALSDPTLSPDISIVVPQYTSNATLTNGANESNNQVVGTTVEYAPVRNLDVQEGQFLTAGQVEGLDRVVVLGATVAGDLFDQADAVGEMIRINGEPFQVVGVLEEAGGAGFGSSDDQAFVPIGVAQGRLFDVSRYRGSYTISSMSIQAAGSERLDAAEQQIERLLRMRHGLGPDDENDFSIFNQASLLEIAGDVAGTLSILLGSIGAVSLLVGGIGIMNIMLVSVTERTREIGLRKALGAHDSDILLQFLIEAMVLCSLGGFIGMVLSYGAAFLLGTVSFMPFSIVIEPWSLVLALTVSTVSGFVFGLYPALRATQLDPIEALRYE